MKHLSSKFLLMLGLLVGISFSCDNDDDGVDILPPTVTAPADAEVETGASEELTFTVTTPGGYESSTVTVDPTTLGTAQITDEPDDGDERGTVVVTFTAGATAATGTVNLEVTDQQSQSRDADVDVSVVAATVEEPETVATVGDTIASIDSLNTLEAALKAAQLFEALNDESVSYTVFAPNDSAFSVLLSSLELNDIDEVVGELTQEGVAGLLRAHVIEDSLPADLLMEQTYETLNGDANLTITKDGNSVFVNGAAVVAANILAGNGVIHIIDSVVNLPMDIEEDTVATVSDTIDDIEDLSTLTLALEATGLDDDLGGDGPFTIFAPDNDAFDGLLTALELGDLDEVISELSSEGVADLLRAHVISGSLPADLLMAQEYETLNENQMLTVTMEGDSVFVNGAGVVRANIFASNGVIHVIDSVVNLPFDPALPESVVDTIASRDDLSLLEDAVDAADLIDILTGDGPFTVFAPDNDAFAALLGRLDEVNNLEDLEDLLGEDGLADLLRAHVVSGSLLSTDITAGELPTLNEDATITVTQEGEDIFVNGAQVIEADLETRNGVVHIIDEVINVSIMPVGNTIAEIPTLDSLEVALTLAELVETLNNEDNTYTVFAPSNEAFVAALNTNGVNTLEELAQALEGDGDDNTSLGALLLNHVVEDRITSAELGDDNTFQTLGGATLTVDVTTSGVTINGVPVSEEIDIAATNGVVHIINGVITE